MTDDLNTDSRPNLSYLWAGIFILISGGLFILAILALRPNLDPLILISTVSGLGITVFSSIAAFLKAQESGNKTASTHKAVNGQLSKWKEEFFALAHAQGVIAGINAEQTRVANQLKETAPPIVERVLRA